MDGKTDPFEGKRKMEPKKVTQGQPFIYLLSSTTCPSYLRIIGSGVRGR